jgi:hypothetical protein
MTTNFTVQFTNALRPNMTSRHSVDTIDEALILADNPDNWPYNNTRVQIFEHVDDETREVNIDRAVTPTPVYTDAEIAPLRAALAAVTRAQLLESGDLVEISDDLKRDAGLRGSVALTRAVWEDCVAWSGADNARKGTVQDETGRAWDVVYMLSLRLKSGPERPVPADGLLYRILRVPRPGHGVRARYVTLKAMFGGCDDGTPALTICLPDED